MTTLSERVLALLENEARPQTNKQIAKQLRLGAREMTALASALTDLNRAKRVRYVNGEGWEKTDAAPPAPPPTRKPAKIEKESPAPAPRQRDVVSDDDADETPAPVTAADSNGTAAESEHDDASQDSDADETENEPEAQDDPPAAAAPAPFVRKQPPRPTRASRLRGEDQRREILRLIAELQPVTGATLIAKMDGALTLHELHNRIDRLKKHGRIVSSPDGYRLTTEATELIKAEIQRFAPRIGVAPMCDVRAKLMEMVDLRAEGKIDRDQTNDMLRILNHVASIDQAAQEQPEEEETE